MLRYLEEELARRYRDAAPATFALLQERSNMLAAELKASESRLHDMQDVASLRCVGELCRTPLLLMFHVWCQTLSNSSNNAYDALVTARLFPACGCSHEASGNHGAHLQQDAAGRRGGA